MKKPRIALLAIFFFGLILFNYPFLSIPRGFFAGIPALLVYLFGAWLLLVLLVLIVLYPTRKSGRSL